MNYKYSNYIFRIFEYWHVFCCINNMERKKCYFRKKLLDMAFFLNRMGMKYSAGGKMALQKQERSTESDKENRSAQNKDLLWDLKEEILEILRIGPVCPSELATRINQPTRKVLRALKEMGKAGVVEKRNYFQDDPEYQPWGIARPSFFR